MDKGSGEIETQTIAGRRRKVTFAIDYVHEKARNSKLLINC